MKKYLAMLLAVMLCGALFAPMTTYAATDTSTLISPAQAIQQAFALYIDNGIDINTAKQKVQEKAREIIANPAGYAVLVQPDIDALKAQLAAAATASAVPAAATVPTVPAAATAPAVPAQATSAAAANAGTITPAQAVQQAFALYVNNGIDVNTAKQRVEEKFGELVLHPTEIASIVQADLAALIGASAPAAALTPEQIIQQIFAKYLGSGMTQEQAMAALTARLMTLLSELQ